MGCAASRVDNDERVKKYKERKRAMKQLLQFRKEFASAILAYLKALKDTGITLRQFTESESLELESNLPSSPPLPLPPSPPLPPPIDSSGSRKLENNQNGQEEISEIGKESNCPPPPPSHSWDIMDMIESSSPQHKVESDLDEDVDDENWAETRSQFEEERQGHGTPSKPSDALRLKSPMVDEDSSIVIGNTKYMLNRAMVMCRRGKTLAGIVRELDDYFLEASAGGKEIAVLVDMSSGNTSIYHDLKESKGNSLYVTHFKKKKIKIW